MRPEQHKQTTEKGNLMKGGERLGVGESTALTPLAKISFSTPERLLSFLFSWWEEG